ncbi:MAG: T9SS type A sorting domain-containing protein [candidate division WOR-3 bacterium]
MKSVVYLSFLLLFANLFATNLPVDQLIGECGTLKMLQNLRAGMKFPRPPNGPKYIYSTHFVIHFDTTGTRAVTRAQAESVSVWAEHSWAKQVDTLGWDEPPPDNNHGVDNRYDIYLMGVDPGGYLGVTFADEPGPDPNQEDWTSWIELTINPNRQVTRPLVAHEFNHACQFSCSGYEGGWWYENTSEWMEKITMGVDHGRVGGGSDNPDPLEDPHVEITCDDDGYEYAGGLWPRFLGEYWSVILPRQIWSLCGIHFEGHTLEDMDSVLRLYYDSDLKKALGHYAIWRYFTGNRGDIYHFSEGASYVTSTILRTHSTYPASGNQGTSNPSGPGGCNFIQFRNFGNNRVTLYFDGENGYEWSAYVIGKRGGISYEYKIPLESTQDTGRITIPGWEYDTIALIPVVTHWTSSAESLTYSYNVTLGDELAAITEPTNIYFNLTLDIYPNPVRTQTTIRYLIPNGKNGKLKIYDATGKAVRNFELMGNKGPASILWDKKDKYGRTVKSGIYFVHLMVDDKTISKKMVIE